jgi:hypothetical protein
MLWAQLLSSAAILELRGLANCGGQRRNIMNQVRKIIVFLLMVLAALGATRPCHATDGEATNNPYVAIASRNMFGLTTPPPTTRDASPDPAVPKITLTGLMSIFGRFQVLFKSSRPNQAGQPAKDQSYVLMEHESQDGIAVLHINVETGAVTFNNHGQVQELFLAGWSVTNSPLLALSEPVEAPAANLPAVYPESFIRARTPDYLGGGPNGLGPDQPLPATTMEERIVLIEAQRAYLKSRHDPAADLLPPTALTPPDAN